MLETECLGICWKVREVKSMGQFRIFRNSIIRNFMFYTGHLAYLGIVKCGIMQQTLHRSVRRRQEFYAGCLGDLGNLRR
jgi:hypothetical protein